MAGCRIAIADFAPSSVAGAATNGAKHLVRSQSDRYSHILGKASKCGDYRSIFSHLSDRFSGGVGFLALDHGYWLGFVFLLWGIPRQKQYHNQPRDSKSHSFHVFSRLLVFPMDSSPIWTKKFAVGYMIIKKFRKKEHHSEFFPSDAFFVILSDIFTPEQLVKSHAKQAGDGDE